MFPPQTIEWDTMDLVSGRAPMSAIGLILLTLPGFYIDFTNDVTLPGYDVTLPGNDVTLPGYDITLPGYDVTKAHTLQDHITCC